MAAPTEQLLSKTYFHGVYNYEVAEFVLQNGIVPPKKSRQSPGKAPLKGAVYVTPNIITAIQYASGLNNKQKQFRYGFIFKIHGNELKDIYPDEDNIDSLFRSYLLYNKKMNDTGFSPFEDPIPENIANIFDRIFPSLNEDEIRILSMGGLASFNIRIKICKKIVKMLLPEEIIQILNLNMNIANIGEIKPFSVIIIDKWLLNNRGWKNWQDNTVEITLNELSKFLSSDSFKNNNNREYIFEKFWEKIK